MVLIANVAFYVLIVRGEQNRVDELHDQYIKIRRRDAQPAKGGNDSTSHYLEIMAGLKKFVDMLPPVVTVADKARELDAVMDRHNFSVNKMTFRPDKTSTFSLWKYTTSFTVTGSYSELKNLLADIQADC